MKICEHLEPVLNHELINENEIRNINTNLSSGIYVIELKKTITFDEPEKLSKDVEYWENNDNHAKLLSGYWCSKCNHWVVGPLKDSEGIPIIRPQEARFHHFVSMTLGLIVAILIGMALGYVFFLLYGNPEDGFFSATTVAFMGIGSVITIIMFCYRASKSDGDD
jgi:hypothetical protein